MSRLFTIRVWVLGWLLALGAGAAYAQTVRLDPKVESPLELEKPSVQIGDIFRVSGVPEQAQREIETIPVLTLRRPGITQNVYDYQVKRELANHGFDRSVEIGGTFPIAIHADEAQISPHYLQEQITTFFRENYSQTIQWSFIGEPALTVFSGEPYSVRFQRPNHVLPGRFALQGILTNGPVTRPFSLLLEITVVQKVLVAREHILPGTLLTRRNTRLEERPLKAYEARNVLGGVSGQSTLEATRDIRPGEVILTTQIKKVALVQPGDPVTMVVQYGNIQVKSMGKAIESGGLHDKIRVRDEQSGKVVVGTLENNHTVKLEVKNTL